MKEILITGLHSFIGDAFERRVGLFPDAYSVKKLSLRSGEWRRADLSGYDCVLHVAGIAHVRYTEKMRGEYMDVNRNLAVEFAQRAKAAGVKQFIFLSSMIVYGGAARPGETRVITSDTPAVPENAYGQSKLEAENALREMEDENFRVCVLRPPTVYGKGCRGNYRTLSKYADYLPLVPDLAGRRSVLYVENLCELARLLIDGEKSGTFYPQDADYASTSELLTYVRSARGRRTRITRLLNPAIRLISGARAARRMLGGIVYEKSMSECGLDYRLFDTKTAISEIEAR